MTRFRNLFGSPGEQGSIAPIVALGLMAFVGFLALGIDLGQLYVVKNDLQNAADGAALAAARRLIQDKNSDGVAEVYCDEAVTAAINAANKNNSLGAPDPITVTAADVVVGKWNLNTKQFDSVGCSTNPMEVNAVQVRVSRTGGDNPQVQTFLGSALGAGDKKDVIAFATAYMGPAGTSAVAPFGIPAEWVNGDPPYVSNGMQRILDKIAPAPAYAGTGTQTYTWYDKGGSNLPLDRATWALTQKDKDENKISANRLWEYLEATKEFPQTKIGEKLYPLSEYYYGWWNLENFKRLEARWNTEKDASGKWRVTVPVFKNQQVTAGRPQNSWLKMASLLIPGVSQAHACTAYSMPVVYTQGFATIDITDVHVVLDCIQTNGSAQLTKDYSCRNQLYMEIKVPLDQNTVSKDKGSNPIPYKKTYQDMNSAASEVGVFASVPRIVK
ncbi:MAG: pilus assembly protein TadG-related protein [Thermodesulfobacteriota bacterium]